MNKHNLPINEISAHVKNDSDESYVIIDVREGCEIQQDRSVDPYSIGLFESRELNFRFHRQGFKDHNLSG